MGQRITIITVGKPSASAADAVAHFVRLLKPYAALDLKPVRSVPLAKGEPVARLMEREARAIRGACDPRACTVALSQEGTCRASEPFARWFGALTTSRPVTFVIGGAYGIDPALKTECAELLSLSNMTLSHDIALLTLLEQLYRAYSILKGHPYHK
jgi:23S rRNA (pseudouridine1915-N3)-methyltransferase